MPEMMLRRHLHLFAHVVLAALLGGVLTPLVGDLHADGDGVCAEDGWAPSHHQTTQFEGIRPSVGDTHCAICHLQRAMNGAADDAKRFVAASVEATLHVVVERRATRSTAPRDVPSRAPPARL